MPFLLLSLVNPLGSHRFVVQMVHIVHSTTTRRTSWTTYLAPFLSRHWRLQLTVAANTTRTKPLASFISRLLKSLLLRLLAFIRLTNSNSPYESSSSFNAVSRKRTLAYKPELQSLFVGVSHYGMTRSRLLGSAFLLPSSLPNQSPGSPIHLSCSITQRQPPYQGTHETNMITGSIGIRRASCSVHTQAKTLSSIIGNTHSHAGYSFQFDAYVPALLLAPYQLSSFYSSNNSCGWFHSSVCVDLITDHLLLQRYTDPGRFYGSSGFPIPLFGLSSVLVHSL